METKKLKRSLAEGVANSKSPSRTEMISAKTFSSPDMLPMGSQECFRVGWDWSADADHKKPKIRIAEAAPRTRYSKGCEKLQCLRPRRLLPIADSDTCDALFMNDLRSLASSLNKSSSAHIVPSTVPTKNKPSPASAANIFTVATSSPSLLTSGSPSTSANILTSGAGQTSHVPYTAVKYLSKNVESDCNSALTYGAPVTDQIPSPHEPTVIEDSLNDLLEDSMCDEMVKCTQELESRLCSTVTPSASDKTSSSSNKKRISLSLKKKTNAKGVCRRLESDKGSSPAKMNSVVEQCKNNKLPVKPSSSKRTFQSGNSCPSQSNLCHVRKEGAKSAISVASHFDDGDGMLIHVGPVEVDFNPTSICTVADQKLTTGSEHQEQAFKDVDLKTLNVECTSLLDSDDFLVSPDVLGLIDQCERKATQDLHVSETVIASKFDAANHQNSVIRRFTADVLAIGQKVNEKCSSDNSVSLKPRSRLSLSVQRSNSNVKLPIKEISIRASEKGSNVHQQCTPQEIEKKRLEAFQKLSSRNKS